MVAADSPAGSVNMQAQKSSKKAKRRSASFSDQNENKEVKPKKKPRKHSFTEVEFCVGLRDSSTTFQGTRVIYGRESTYYRSRYHSRVLVVGKIRNSRRFNGGRLSP